MNLSGQRQELQKLTLFPGNLNPATLDLIKVIALLAMFVDHANTLFLAHPDPLLYALDRVSSLTARLESQEKASSEQLVRMGSEIASLTDRCTQLENQRDDARLETMGEKETVAALRGEAEALKRQNQSLMAALSGNKQTGGQNA